MDVQGGRVGRCHPLLGFCFKFLSRRFYLDNYPLHLGDIFAVNLMKFGSQI